MPRLTTAETVIESLLAHGIDTLFALPGVHNDHLFDAAHKASDRIRVIHPRHEQTAAYMALGAALVTGKPQAFAVVPGPGGDPDRASAGGIVHRRARTVEDRRRCARGWHTVVLAAG